MMRKNLRLAVLLVTCAVLFATPSWAAQIMVLNMKASAGASEQLAQSLTPILITELSRRQGMSIIAQEDVRALLENEAQKQNLGCDSTSCMTEIAGSLGTELLVSSTLGKIGRQYVVHLTLFDVQRAKAFRRSSAKQGGGEEAAAEAVVAAVHDLFRDGLPEDLQGPASFSRRGFEASLQGFAKLVLDPKVDPKAARRRIILDLVNTELDYDVKPKLRALELASRRQIARIDDDMLLSKDSADRDRMLRARSYWVAIYQDMERVKEIRTRARERGVVPSGRPLRFQAPEPTEWPAATDISAYKKTVKPGLKLVKKALRAYQKGDKSAFLALWTQDQQGSGERFYRNQKDRDKRYKRSLQLAALHALSPSQLERAIDQNKKGELLVVLAELRAGKIYDDDYVYLIQEKGKWRIRSW